MRTLKKSLCLVLALVMVLGLFVMGANATSYTPYGDEADVNYLDAVQVLTGLGVIEGRTDGNFDPKATVTRAEACAMITRMVLGREAADKLPVGDVKFSDVSLESWEGRMAKYIAFCANRGIVVGMGDGTFHPTEPVTGTQLATMLLRALGRGVMGEYEGKGWDINAVADALYFKVFEDSEVTDFSQAASREETALYVFNALWADRVAWDVDVNDYVILLGTFGSEVYDLERIEKAQVMANQATGDPYTVVRVGTKTEKTIEVEVQKEVVDEKTGEKKIEKTIEKRTETVDEYEYINLDYESDLGLIAHEVTVYRNIGKEYKDKDNNKFWKTYLLQDKSVTVTYKHGAEAYKALRDANRENLTDPWQNLNRVQYWLNYVFQEDNKDGLVLYDLNYVQFKTIPELKGWETCGGFTCVLDSESHLLAQLDYAYSNDQVKKISGEDIYLRLNDYAEEWDTYDMAYAYEGIKKGDYVTVQPVGKLCYLYPTTTSEILVFDRRYNTDHGYPIFNDYALLPGPNWNKITPNDCVDPCTVLAGDKVLFYLDYYGKFFATQILERGTLDGVVYVNYVFTKTGEGTYGDDDVVVYAQCVNEKGEEVIYKLSKDDYKAEADAGNKDAALTKMRGLKEGKVFKAYLDKKGYATLSATRDLGVLAKEKGKTTYLTRDGGTYYVTKDTKIFYVNGIKEDLKVTKSKTLPATEVYDEVFAYFIGSGTTWNNLVLWIVGEAAPKASDSYIYVAASDTVENSGTELVDGKKTYYFNSNVYVDGVAPMGKIFIDVSNEYIDATSGYPVIQPGFYIYNTEEKDGKLVYDVEKLVPEEDNPVVEVMDTITLTNGDVKDGKFYFGADGDTVDVKIVILNKKKCVSWDKKRYLKFDDITDIGDFLDDEEGNTVTVSYLATKINDKLVPFGTIYIIEAHEEEP